MPQKFAESSRAVMLLRKKLAAGGIPRDSNPKKIWASDPVRMNHKLEVFWAKLNKLKLEYNRESGGKIYS